MFALLRQRAGNMEKETVHLAHLFTVIIHHDHCRVGTYMAVSPIAMVQDRRRFTASFQLYSVFNMTTETSECRARLVDLTVSCLIWPRGTITMHV